MVSTRITQSVAMSSIATSTAFKVIDSHVHVWGTPEEATSQGFPYLQDPPDTLKNRASAAMLANDYMTRCKIDGCLIVQPINYKYDHSYVIKAIKDYPEKYKGMLLHDPLLDTESAVARLEELSLQGFVGVRFNPYLWPKTTPPTDASESGSSTSLMLEAPAPQWEPMSQGAGLAVYKRCGELRMPVGIMCFQGLSLHYNDILELIKVSPDTILILDHMGFTTLTDATDENDAGSRSNDDAQSTPSFDQLLSLAQYPQVHVKISALFRIAGSADKVPYERVHRERFEPLMRAYGSQRLLFGTDFPFVLEEESEPSADNGNSDGSNPAQIVSSWMSDETDRRNVMGGTAERLFGAWGTK
jgi:predicted TIM-barrel fold metal-dependent hydrolase